MQNEMMKKKSTSSGTYKTKLTEKSEVDDVEVDDVSTWIEQKKKLFVIKWSINFCIM